ncbi:multidrug-resistance like protein 1 isoform i [Anaeramoeba flamelloides]|uniref:Multidrug-resistance like protein 1 isoform i n=1 Tax=Anaeramoeba flamelloides TaxID=1746091 RepID=A0AAV7Z6M3_9EUKA|nr:multidrug-resistance like protein 1 isoform i [Anaeramoeba flamelloides]
MSHNLEVHEEKDEPPRPKWEGKQNPELETTGILFPFFRWVTPLLDYGKRYTLQLNDLYPIYPNDEPNAIWKRLSKNYPYSVDKRDKKISFPRSLLRTFKPELMKGFLPRLLADLCILFTPIVLYFLIDSLEDKQKRNKPTIFWAIFGLFALNFFQSFFQQMYFVVSARVSYRVKSSLISLIYKKSLVVNRKVISNIIKEAKGKDKDKDKDKSKSKSKSKSNKDKNKKKLNDQNTGQDFEKEKESKEVTVGEIVTMMGTDTQKIENAFVWFHNVWSMPFRLIASFLLMYNIIGVSAVIGFFAITISIPFNKWVMKKFTTLHLAVMKLLDFRIKIMNEILQGIKIIKFYAWERFFDLKVMDARKSESRSIKRMLLWRVGYMANWIVMPLLATIITFVSYTALFHNELTAARVFATIALFRVMRSLLVFIPWIVVAMTQAKGSVFRVKRFLNAGEISVESKMINKNRSLNSTKDISVKMEKCYFDWEAKPKNSVDLGNTLSLENDFTGFTEKKNKNNNKTKIEDLNGFESKSGSESGSGSENLIENGYLINGDSLSDREVNINKKNHRNTLSNINLEIKRGTLTTIIGKVGSGKSSLFSAILGEIPKLVGDIEVNGSIAYSSQESWILHGTLKENIIFYNEFDETKYNHVLDICALRPDLEILPNGDLTEIGEKGVNLSGGQKQRVSLARSVYSNKDILLLDDPLSAVDAHVGKHLFDNCIKGDLLKSKTVLLVSHQIQYLPQSDYIIVIEDGGIIDQGTYNELVNKDFHFSNNQDNMESKDQEKKENELELELEKEKEKEQEQEIENENRMEIGTITEIDVKTMLNESDFNNEIQEEKENLLNEDEESKLDLDLALDLDLDLVKDQKTKKKNIELIKEEYRETGTVKWEHYLLYFKSAGGLGVIILIVVISLLGEVGRSGSDYWLAIWTERKYFNNKSDLFFIMIYLIFGFVTSIFTVCKSYSIAISTVKAGTKLHNKSLFTILKAPMSFFDTTPVGRILNRFNKDMHEVDLQLGMVWDRIIIWVCSLIGGIIVIISVTPYFTIPLVLILLIYYRIMQYYRKTSREIKRLESISKSPIYSHFGETLDGLATIRAFNVEKKFMKRNLDNLSVFTRAIYCGHMSNRWLAIRLELIGALTVLSVSLFVWFARNSLEPSFGALAITISLQITTVFTWIVRNFTQLEKNMNAVERMCEYTNLPTEALPLINRLNKELSGPSTNWPANGKIEFRNIKMRYRPELGLVLNGISAIINSQEKVGIIGRTGSGKSSLVLTLFRIVELFEGQILIDDIDISEINLEILRSKIAIIPQDPILFSGSIRKNLDPINENDRPDKEYWEALELVQLKDKIQSLKGGLDHLVTEGGENFSVGEKQLVCLARALLKNTKILILDEATSSVDNFSDDLIQKTIRKEFKHCTTITIAHRLHTIMDSDRIMSLKDGLLYEFDTPVNLLKNENSLLYSLVRDTGKQNTEKLRKISNGQK